MLLRRRPDGPEARARGDLNGPALVAQETLAQLCRVRGHEAARQTVHRREAVLPIKRGVREDGSRFTTGPGRRTTLEVRRLSTRWRFGLPCWRRPTGVDD
jgi:hypothetical protein